MGRPPVAGLPRRVEGRGSGWRDAARRSQAYGVGNFCIAGSGSDLGCKHPGAPLHIAITSRHVIPQGGEKRRRRRKEGRCGSRAAGTPAGPRVRCVYASHCWRPRPPLRRGRSGWPLGCAAAARNGRQRAGTRPRGAACPRPLGGRPLWRALFSIGLAHAGEEAGGPLGSRRRRRRGAGWAVRRKAMRGQGAYTLRRRARGRMPRPSSAVQERLSCKAVSQATINRNRRSPARAPQPASPQAGGGARGGGGGGGGGGGAWGWAPITRGPVGAPRRPGLPQAWPAARGNGPSWVGQQQRRRELGRGGARAWQARARKRVARAVRR
jgi:hypothetical protein